MPQLVIALLIIVAAGYVLHWRFGGGEEAQPNPKFSDNRVSPRVAPVYCGPYFLYLHPDYYQLDRNGRAANRYRLTSISDTPPDAKTDTIHQLWASKKLHGAFQTERTVFEHERSFPRTATRPVMWYEVTFGDYIGDHWCKPYKPGTLHCRERKPRCD